MPVVGRSPRFSGVIDWGPSHGLRGQAHHRAKVVHFYAATWPVFTPPLTVCQSASACTEDGKPPPDRNWSIRLHSHHPRHATISLCTDRLDRSQVEIKASRDTRTGFITLDHSCKKNPKRPQIEASRRKVQEMQRIRVFGSDNRPFLLCLPSCCRSVSGLLPICYRRVSDVFFTCSSQRQKSY